jgi:ABC-type lipopolysaccharide export system ATPase subunit
MLVIDSLTGGYGNVQILNGATLKVAKGQIVALLGGNGTGVWIGCIRVRSARALLPSFSGPLDPPLAADP